MDQVTAVGFSMIEQLGGGSQRNWSTDYRQEREHRHNLYCRDVWLKHHRALQSRNWTAPYPRTRGTHHRPTAGQSGRHPPPALPNANTTARTRSLRSRDGRVHGTGGAMTGGEQDFVDFGVVATDFID